jgi:hypothetical protein
MSENAKLLKQYFNIEQGGQFDFAATSYSESKNIGPIDGCYGFMAINKCNGQVIVNDIPLLGFIAPGLSGEVWGYVDNYRLYSGVIRLQIPAGLTTTLVVIIQVYKIPS